VTLTGVGVQWSSDGNRLAFYNGARGETVVYDMALRRAAGEVNEAGLRGVFSPEGSEFYYPAQTAQDSATVWTRPPACGTASSRGCPMVRQRSSPGAKCVNLFL